MLTSFPILAYPDFNLPFVLHTDASNEGLGAVLYQEQGGKLRVIAYGSRTLTPAEKNYHLHSNKLEFLALKWAICDKFRDYLYYAPTFTVFTDNNPLTYILSTAKLSAVGHRWVGELADFHFAIKYRPGKTNTDADTLSRFPVKLQDHIREYSEVLPPEVVSAIWQGDKAQREREVPWVAALQLGSTDDNMLPASIPLFPPEDIRAAQKGDASIVEVIALKEKDGTPVTKTRDKWDPPHDGLYTNGINFDLTREFYTDKPDNTDSWFSLILWSLLCSNTFMMTWGMSALTKLPTWQGKDFIGLSCSVT